MNRLVSIISVFCMFLLSACAMLDISHMQTAVPLGTHHLDASLYMGAGLNLNPTQDFSEIYDEIAASDTLPHTQFWSNSQSDWIYWKDQTTIYYGGLNLAYGLGPKTDVFLRVSDENHWKLGVKQLLWNEEDNYFAVMPVVNYNKRRYTGWDMYHDDIVFQADDRYLICGTELHGIYTHKPNKTISLTVSPHVAMTMFSRQYNGTDYGPYYVVHGGVQGNARVNFWHLFMLGEIGLEALDLYHKGLTAVPNYAFTFGIHL